MDEQEDYDPLDEKGLPARDGKGRFRKGSSGNPRGKKMQLPRDPRLPASRRRIISDVADKMIEVAVEGEKRRMSLFEANVYSIAVAGAKGNRIAAQRFIDLMLELADRDLERRLASHQLIDRMNRIADENEQLKKKHAPTSGVLVVGPEEFDKWQAERWLDDEEGVAEVLPRSTPKV